MALGLQFEDVAGGTGTKSISELIDPAKLNSNTDPALSDQIWRYDSVVNKWVKYFYGKASRFATPEWKRLEGEEGKDLTDKDVVKVGETVLFYRSGAATTITLAGGVRPFGNPQGYTLNASVYTFIAYPWPVALPIADFSKYYTPTSNTDPALCDQVWRYDNVQNKWVKYFYGKASRFADPEWKRLDGNEGKTLTDADVIPAGEGALIYRAGAACQLLFTFGTDDK